VKSIQIVGRKKTGKTSYVVRLLPLLVGRGLKVGTVKHSAHPHPLDKPRSDSLRHRDAGADATLVIAAAFAALHFSTPEDPKEAHGLIERYLGGFDLVLVEGWNEMPGPKIEILPSDAKGQPDSPVHLASGDLMAAVYTQGLHSETRYLNGPCSYVEANPPDLIPCYHWVEIEAVADLILRWMELPVQPQIG
jgi:molybdopterin-guanine dinucleotide biosynthesis adapter protein